MRNYTLIRLIQQAIKQFRLDLSGYNVLVPVYSREHPMTAILAAMAGAKNIYVATREIETINKVAFYENEFEFSSNITFIEKETPQILSALDIILLGRGISFIDGAYTASLKKEAVISILPENLDFLKPDNINIEECTSKKIPIVCVEPADPNLSLYKHLAGIVTKRCRDNGVDLLRSKILLVSNGDLLDYILIQLKSEGAQVYTAHTDKPQDKAYMIKHLREADAVVVADYPQKSTLVVGNEGFIRVDDILSINPEVKIIHLAGKMQPNALTINRIHFAPVNIVQNTLNVNIAEMGLRSAVEIASASLKAAESLIKSKNRAILQDNSVVSYDIINTEGPEILGKVLY